jgi:8-oxo-dGTP pyrophosphatase MutT (NUDIX family)
MKQHGKWTITSSKSVYKNPWMEVIEDKVVRPDSSEGIYGTIKLKRGVSALPIDEQGNVYLINEYKYPVSAHCLEVMGAGIEDDESPLDAAQRELKEELGITAEKWIDLGISRPLTSFINSPQHIFIAQELNIGEQELDGAEDIRVIKMPLAEAVQKVMDSEITEQKSCTLILKAARLFNI